MDLMMLTFDTMTNMTMMSGAFITMENILADYFILEV
jgi:hypothetical protein